MVGIGSAQQKREEGNLHHCIVVHCDILSSIPTLAAKIDLQCDFPYGVASYTVTSFPRTNANNNSKNSITPTPQWTIVIALFLGRLPPSFPLLSTTTYDGQTSSVNVTVEIVSRPKIKPGKNAYKVQEEYTAYFTLLVEDH